MSSKIEITKYVFRPSAHFSGEKIVLRPLAPSELDFEFHFLIITIATALCSLAWLQCGLPWPKCWLRKYVGCPCPACGATRCALALLRGDLQTSFFNNPFFFASYLVTLVIDLYSGAVLALRLPRIRLNKIPAQEFKRALAILVAFAVLANWFYLFFHQ